MENRIGAPAVRGIRSQFPAHGHYGGCTLSGGSDENVCPREVEEFLYSHPAIQEVQVFGVPDDKYGEEICAWIQLKAGAQLTAEDVKAFCKDRITHFKIPQHICFVDEYPMTVTGKIQKFKMREAMVADLSED